MKRYFELTIDERVVLNDQDLSDAIRLEAIDRGIAPPLLLNEEIQRGIHQAYSEPANAVTFYEVMRAGRWGSQAQTGLAFSTKEEAEKACLGAFSLEDGKIVSGQFSVRCVKVQSGGCYKVADVEEYVYDSSKYDAVADECLADLREIKQRRYDAEIMKHKKAEYMRLAKGDKAIAKAFWQRTESSTWPEELIGDKVNEA